MRLPSFLTGLSPVGKVVDAMEQGASALETEAQRHNAQVTVSTATDGLPLWERDYGLPSGGDAAARRRRILAALLGEQTLTREQLRRLAAALAGADDSTVEEDFPAYAVTLTALYNGRTPENITALREAVERLHPAHLRMEVLSALALAGEQTCYLGQHGGVYLHVTSEEGGTTA